MKKLLLLGLALSFGFLTSAQKVKVNSSVESFKRIDRQMSSDPFVKSPALTQSKLSLPAGDATKNSRFLTILTLGTSANGYSYGYGGGNRTILWADDNLNTVINMHRMGPGSSPPTLIGNLSVDKSIDMGATFTNNFQVYKSNIVPGAGIHSDAARYPQGALYNPPGNTDPANAYVTFFAPSLDCSNDPASWGGYALGVANLVDNSDSSKLNITSRPDENIYQNVPDGMTVCQTGDMWGADINIHWISSTTSEYMGNQLLTHGVFDPVAKRYDYTQFTIDVPGERPTNNKIAFAPDGMTGWLVALGDFDNLDSDSSFYPILWKTMDGGITWSEPIEVILSGVDGIYTVKNYLSDNQLATLFDPIPPRDEIAYTTAFDCDLVVDALGNPHVAVVISPSAGEYSVPNNTYPYIHAAFDITSPDGGLTWTGQWLKNNRNMRHIFGTASTDPSEDNRIQASTTMDGTKVFISWIESVLEIPGIVDNDNPDIFLVGIDPINNKFTDTLYVTYDSDAMFEAFCANASHYVFTDNNKFTIPFTYEVVTDNNLLNPVTYKYISDFSLTEADFIHVGLGEPIKTTKSFTVNPAYPNPATGKSVVKVNLAKASSLNLAVYNLTGQKVLEQNYSDVNAGTFDLTIDCSGFNAGIYFYTVRAGDNSITKKLIVK